jgi:hypothetical protein
MCQYLFAAFSLKQREDEGLAGGELAAVNRWRTAISHVATEEMLHLALVHNLLSAIGAAPHFGRPNLPAPAHHYPGGVNLMLVPFAEQALQLIVKHRAEAARRVQQRFLQQFAIAHQCQAAVLAGGIHRQNQRHHWFTSNARSMAYTFPLAFIP